MASRSPAPRPSRRTTDAADYQHVPRAVAAMPKTFADGSSTGWHSHVRAQLLFATQGVMTVDTATDRWMVPPMRALWIPPGELHQVRMRGRVEMRTLYLAPTRRVRLPARCAALAVTPLARALIERATELPLLYDERGADGLAMRLLIAEVERLPAMTLSLPLPVDPALVDVCARMTGSPSVAVPVAELAARAGLGERTFTRRFVAQTALTPGQWRQRMVALEALARLSARLTVTRVALDLGYDSPSAFSAMFRRVLGISPSEAAAPHSTTSFARVRMSA